VGKVAAEPMVPQVGVAAGAMSATCDLHLLLLDTIVKHRNLEGPVCRSIRVHDIIRDFSGATYAEVVDLVLQPNAII
jgi:hypothetical protein